MNSENLEQILQEMTSGKLSLADYKQINTIIKKYQETSELSENIFQDEPFIDDGFELPNDDFQIDDEQLVQEEVNTVTEKKESVIPKIDENGQYLLSLDEEPQTSFDFEKLEEVIKNNNSIKNNEPVVTSDLIDKKLDSDKIEPIFSIEDLHDVNQNVLSINDNSLNQYQNYKQKSRFSFFENVATSTLSKFNNAFKFRDENGKIDWYSHKEKTILLLSNVKNAVLDNKIVNSLGKFISNKFKDSSIGIRTTQMADTITINLMSRKDRYNKEFKNTLSLMGYDVTELLSTEHNSKLNLKEVGVNINTELEKTTGLILTNDGYQSNVINSLASTEKIEFIEKIVWPKLTDMMKESVKINQAINEIKRKNPYYKKIAEMAKSAEFSEEMTINLLLNNPNILKEKGIKGVDKLLENKIDIERMYAKNEELCGKSFIALQNIVKAATNMNNLIINLEDVSPKVKEYLFLKMRSTVIDSNKDREITFETLQTSINATLQDKNFVKSLRNVNDSITKIREKAQTTNNINKPTI